MPRLAESWTWEDGYRRLRIRLREGVVLHDGRRLDAQMVAEALLIAVGDQSNRDSSPAFPDLRAAIPVGELDLLLQLAKPSPQLPVDLTVLLEIKAGPFRTVTEEENRIELERFDRYYQGVPAISKVTLLGFNTLRTGWASLMRGELDMVYDVPVDAVEFVRNDDIDVVSVPRWYQHQLIFNARDKRFRSPLVRKALNLAVDREAIIKKVLRGAGEPSGGPVYPRYWAFDSSVTGYSSQPAAAAALLDAAGYPLRKATREAPPTRFRFTCLIPKDFAIWQRIALAVQKDLFNIGVDMQFKVVPLKEFGTLIIKGQLEAAYVDMISGPTPTRSYMWWRSAHSYQGLYNVFGYENAQAEELFETLVRSTNDVEIRSATARMQRVLHDDPPALYVAWDTRTRAINRRFVLPRNERDPVWALWKWTVPPETTAALNR